MSVSPVPSSVLGGGHVASSVEGGSKWGKGVLGSGATVCVCVFFFFTQVAPGRTHPSSKSGIRRYWGERVLGVPSNPSVLRGKRIGCAFGFASTWGEVCPFCKVDQSISKIVAAPCTTVELCQQPHTHPTPQALGLCESQQCPEATTCVCTLLAHFRLKLRLSNIPYRHTAPDTLSFLSV